MDLAARGRSCGREYPHAAPSISRLFEKDLLASADPQMRLNQFPERRTRSFLRQRFRIGGAAEFPDRTDFTLWPRPADKRSEIHERGIEDASIPFWDESGGELPDSIPSPARVNALFVIEKSREKTRDVCIDNRK